MSWRTRIVRVGAIVNWRGNLSKAQSVVAVKRGGAAGGYCAVIGPAAETAFFMSASGLYSLQVVASSDVATLYTFPAGTRRIFASPAVNVRSFTLDWSATGADATLDLLLPCGV